MAQLAYFRPFLLTLAACAATDDGKSVDEISMDTGIGESPQDSSGEDSGMDDETGGDTADTGLPEDSGEPEDSAEPDLVGEMTSFSFRATHNSYSGGVRSDILTQLNNGVRGLEFDIHDNDYLLLGDYQIGHHTPGGEVDHSGFNPLSNHLSDWLNQVADWSMLNPQHAPLTLVLDIKDNLTDNYDFQSGNLAALNSTLLSAFGDGLHIADGEALPDISLLRERIVCVLSGDGQTRELYKRDRGENPSVALNAQGQVLAVHDSGTGFLWYWSGQMNQDGTVKWLRHGRYGTGEDPAVALNNSGRFVTVHKSENHDTLWAHVGRLDAGGEPVFSTSLEYDSGVSPTVRFIDKDSDELVERHLSASTGYVWSWSVSLAPTDLVASWTGNNQSQSPLFNSAQDGDLFVYTSGHAWAGSDTLLYQTATQGPTRIRYPQLCYVEVQPGDSAELSHHETYFFAASAGDSNAIDSWNGFGMIRGWGFDESHTSNGLLYHYPASDDPFSDWMDQWCIEKACIE